jgi:replicative superfamily II helicase
MSELLRVLEAYKNVGVIELADYQRDILNDRKFYPPESSNLLLSAPTGCGKNVVIEILATTNVLNTAKKCIFILPYIAAAQETFFKLQVYNLLPLNFHK